MACRDCLCANEKKKGKIKKFSRKCEHKFFKLTVNRTLPDFSWIFFQVSLRSNYCWLKNGVI